MSEEIQRSGMDKMLDNLPNPIQVCMADLRSSQHSEAFTQECGRIFIAASLRLIRDGKIAVIRKDPSGKFYDRVVLSLEDQT